MAVFFSYLFKTGVCYTVLAGLDIVVTHLALWPELGFQAFPPVLEIFFSLGMQDLQIPRSRDVRQTLQMP